jgi:serine/threonine protein kinase
VSDLPEGTVLAGCRIEAVAGRGGMGVVYRARHLRLDRTVAVKVIAAHIGEDPTFEARFEREARSAAALDHPHIVPVYDAGDVGGRLYMVMRWVDGVSLKSLLRNGPLATEWAAALATQLASALGAAHAHGLTHRDVKPANVMVEVRDDRLHSFLCDFGIAHLGGSSSLTGSGDILGTIDYAAPEQLDGSGVEPRSDQYSLACMLVEALTGSVPFARDTPAAKALAHLNEAPNLERQGLTPSVRAVLGRALSKDPSDRFPTMDSFATAFRDAADGRSSDLAGDRTAQLPTVRRSGSRRAILLALLGAVGVAVAAGVVALTSGGDNAPPRAAPRSDRADILRVLKGYERAFTRQDIAGLRRLFTSGVSRHGLRLGGCSETRGRQAVLDASDEQFHGGSTSYHLLDLKSSNVHLSGGHATLESRYTISTGGAGQIRFELRSSGGAWRIARVVAPC